jgi:hypothetical protein
MAQLSDYRLSLGRNRIMNGQFRVDQRSNGAVINNLAGYCVDRWFGTRPAAGAGMKAQRVAATLAMPIGSFQFALAFGRVAGNTGITFIQVYHTLESADSIDLAGRAVTLSFWARAGVNYSGGALTAQVISGTGTDQGPGTFSGAVTVATTSPSITTTWRRYTVSGNVGASATQLGVTLFYTPSGTAGADDNVYITGVQFEQGWTATDFEIVPLVDDLDRCRRYLPAYTASAGTAATIALGQCISTTAANVYFMFGLPARVPPTGVTVSSAGHFTVDGSTGTGLTATGVTFVNSSTRAGELAVTIGAASLVAGNATVFSSQNASAQLLFTGAEL